MDRRRAIVAVILASAVIAFLVTIVLLAVAS